MCKVEVTKCDFFSASEGLRSVFNVSLPTVVVVTVAGVIVVAAVIIAVKMVKKCKRGK